MAGRFADKNVGTGKTVSVTGITISGTDASNYSFNTTASTTADITAAALTVSATGVNKVYNGDATATVTLSDNRVVRRRPDRPSPAQRLCRRQERRPRQAVLASPASRSAVPTPPTTPLNTGTSTHRQHQARARHIHDLGHGGQQSLRRREPASAPLLSDDRVAGDVFSDTYTSTLASRTRTSELPSR